MNFPRSHHNLTLLPDGTVLVTGGSRDTGGYDATQAVFEAELWLPQTETWKKMATMRVPRLYHSTALLLPDGRVLVAGGGRFPQAINQLKAEIYSPPYLFQSGSRPVISSAPATIQYGNTFVIQTPNASDIGIVSLVRPGAVTHAYNQDQRFLNLSFQPIVGGLSVTVPDNRNLAPPGYYMLFVLNTNGVPSRAFFVRLQ